MRYVLGLDEVGAASRALVGGKAANLGELTALDGVAVPAGCCVTTAAYRDVVQPLVDRHPAGDPGLAAAIAGVPLPATLIDELAAALDRLGAGAAYAVRSSATAEDLPGASFAGQQDSVLDVTGLDAVCDAVRRCWASLVGERAVAYRRHRGAGQGPLAMAVVVQRMIHPRAAGVLFTADPLSGDRTVCAVEATAGTADALVSGTVPGDAYTVRQGTVNVVRLAGRTPLLTDDDARRLAGLGRRIEAHFGRPQDIEWCLDDDGVHVVQARPVTTLFPVPPTGDGAVHVYLSVGHQQMMTDPMTPLGLSVWQLTTARPMAEAGGRLFVDVTAALTTRSGRAGLLARVGHGDPLTGDALRTLIDRGVVPLSDDGDAGDGPAAADPAPLLAADPALAAQLRAATRASLADAGAALRGRTGTDLLDALVADTARMREHLFDPRSMQVITAALEAAGWLRERLPALLGDTAAADVLSRAVAHDVTAEMGLALLDVADAVRPHPAVVALLERVAANDPDGDAWLDDLAAVPGGAAAGDALRAFLARHGMRCPGEIDVARERWAERPAALVPTVLGHVRAHAPGEAARRVARGRREADAERERVLARLRARPGGGAAAEQAAAMIDRVRAFGGYREFPKYGLICRYALYRRALLDEAGRLVAAGVLRRRDDVHFLRLEELREVVRTQRADAGLIARRRAEQATYAALATPRVLTSDGETLNGRLRHDVPAGALAGVPVSAGVAEGRVRVVADPARADLRPGDVLVTACTDPSWTPLFVSAAALVTEVGGLMTHGAVIAREYGLPAVVGVEAATRRLRDGQRVRVDGTLGVVTPLDDPGQSPTACSSADSSSSR